MNKEKLRQQLDSEGFALQGIWGGPAKKRYFTPDGREIFAIPCSREFVIRDAQGKTIQTGTRDANLDKGWLETPPLTPKPYCSGCDNWHDTPGEVAACKKSKRAQTTGWERRVRQRLGSEKEQDLRTEVSELKALVKQLLEEKRNGSKEQGGQVV